MAGRNNNATKGPTPAGTATTNPMIDHRTVHLKGACHHRPPVGDVVLAPELLGDRFLHGLVLLASLINLLCEASTTSMSIARMDTADAVFVPYRNGENDPSFQLARWAPSIGGSSLRLLH